MFGHQILNQILNQILIMEQVKAIIHRELKNSNFERKDGFDPVEYGLSSDFCLTNFSALKG